MNIREFAELCGISASSASRILNHSLKDSRASRDTYERIHRKAEELGYKPNYAAKTLHTKKSNCIGVILANPVPVNTMSILRGITDCTDEHRISLTIATCRNHPELEAAAFENMLYRGVDAILWHPTFQYKTYDTGHVGQILKNHPRRVPVFCLSAQAPEGVFKFKTNAEEDGSAAALRQLKCRCREFAVIRNAFSMESILRASEAYRSTLLSHGVPEEKIISVQLNDPENPPQWDRFRTVDGVWSYTLFALHGILPRLREVCDLGRLHVDGQSFTDDYAFSYWAALQYGNVKFEDQFASLQCHLIDFAVYARRAAEIVIQAMKDPSVLPYDEPVTWTMPPPGFVPEELLCYW